MFTAEITADRTRPDSRGGSGKSAARHAMHPAQPRIFARSQLSTRCMSVRIGNFAQ
jgi:hypothetical protein